MRMQYGSAVLEPHVEEKRSDLDKTASTTDRQYNRQTVQQTVLYNSMAPKTRSKTKAQATQSRLAKQYLVFYNTVESLLWAAVIVHFGMVAREHGLVKAHDSVSRFLLLVQTSAVLEIVHAALGLVSSPIGTTVMQVFSRLLLVWGIDYLFPEVTASSPAFASMVLAWSVTEVLRYAYYAINLQGQVPETVMKLRYTLFYVLYPMGAGSEAWLVYSSLDKAKELSKVYWGFLLAILAIYPPGFYMLYTYMIAQRRKMLKRQGKRAVR